MWCLLICPYESVSGEWEIMQFPTEFAAQSEQQKRDLTKEWYIVPVEELAELLRADFQERYEDHD